MSLIATDELISNLLLQESSKNKDMPTSCSSRAVLPHFQPHRNCLHHPSDLCTCWTACQVAFGYITASAEIAPSVSATVALIPQPELGGKPLEDGRPVRWIDQAPRSQTLVQYPVSPRSTCLLHGTRAPLCMVSAYL